jgi:peptide/nickel transport system ATP-binding protein
VLGGEIILQGKSVLELDEKKMRELRGKEVSMVFQDPTTALNPVFRIKDQMLRVIKDNLGLDGIPARQHAMQLLKEVELPDPAEVLESFPYELSGGMQQRVMIAMALASNPKLIIADEPTSAVDATIQTQILNLLKRLRKDRDFSMVLITHSIAVAAEVSDRIAVMYAGEIVEVGEAKAVVQNPKHPYTEGLVKCIPKPRAAGSAKGELPTVPGQVPDLVSPPTGCRFHPRCPYVMEICSKERPAYWKAGESLALCHLYREKS